MKRLAPAVFLLLTVACVCARAQTASEISLTIEVSDGALLVTGPEPLIKALDSALQQAPAPGRTTESTRVFIHDLYGDALAVEVFALPGEGELPDVSVVALPLRQAVLDGRLPPVEGLAADEMEALVRAFGFRTVKKDVFDAMTPAQEIALLYESTAPLIVYAGTGAFDPIALYVRSEKPAKADAAEANP